MKKTLLIAAAALAASVISSQAQVYSQNIVGYVNVPAKGGYTTVANPLDNGNGNALTNLVPPGATWDGTLVSTWTGTTYNIVTIDSTIAGGVADAGDNFAVACPVLPTGVAFFVNNVGSSNTLTLVGTVHVDGAGAGTVGVTTNTIPSSPALTFISSKLPVAGGLKSILNLGAGADGCLVSIPTINPSGSITGFNTVTVDSTFASGFGDAGDNFEVAEPTISVGTGFFFNNTLGTPVLWTQSF